MRRIIARYLGVDRRQILRCEEWVTVLFVIVKGWRPTFVSKKILKLSPQFLPGDVVVSQGGSCYEVINQLHNHVRCSRLDISLSGLSYGDREQLIFPTHQLTIISSPQSTREELHRVREVVATPPADTSERAKVEVVRASVGVNSR
ncbi:MAG: hypothetical protein QNJ32_25840 [Xenococcaceae cyanobacterium MO_167.B27]|nr:hypothetical protein [Xenococcaceae cyanobacterium MO_167.B27]